MKNILCPLVLFIALVGALHAESVVCDNVRSNCGADGWQALVTDGKINVRSEPNTGGEKIFQLNAGDVVTVLNPCLNGMLADEAYAMWVKIRCGGGTGYVCSRWLTPCFVKVSIEGGAKSEYICHTAFYRPRKNGDGDGIFKRYVKDEFLYIRDGKVFRIKSESNHDEGASIFSEETPVTDLSLELSVEYHTGYEDDKPMIVAYEKIKINEKNYYRATMFRMDWWNLRWERNDTSGFYYFEEVMKSRLFDEDDSRCRPSMSFSAKTFDLREKEWGKTEQKLYPCEYLETIRWVNR